MNYSDGDRAVPVVMPLIRIDDNCGGSAFILTAAGIADASSSQGERVLADELGGRIGELVQQVGTSVRIEVHDADGAVHADILDPATLPAPPTASRTVEQQPELSTAFTVGAGDTAAAAPVAAVGAEQLWISESGWEPGESVLICVALATCHADPDGLLQAQISLDHWPQQDGKVVLVPAATVPVRARIPPRP